MKFCN